LFTSFNGRGDDDGFVEGTLTTGALFAAPGRSVCLAKIERLALAAVSHSIKPAIRKKFSCVLFFMVFALYAIRIA